MPLANKRGVATFTGARLRICAAIWSGLSMRSSQARLVLSSSYEGARTWMCPLCSRMEDSIEPRISPLITEAINNNRARPMPNARAEKNERRRLRPRSRIAILNSCVIADLTRNCRA